MQKASFPDNNAPDIEAEINNSALQVKYLTREQYAEICQSQLPVLGAVCHGFQSNDVVSWPVVVTKLQPLTSICVELYLADITPVYCCNGMFDYAVSQSHIFGTLRNEEAESFSNIGKIQSMYCQLLLFTQHRNTAHITRMWNIIPQITMSQNDSDNYQEFCYQRSLAFDAFELHGRALPAASAIGSDSGPFNLYFLAGNSNDHTIENSNQISAYEYPEQYGRRPPAFARARLCKEEDTWRLLISGTASILGHETRHHGDVAAQSCLTLTNIQQLVAETEVLCGKNILPQANKQLFKVYVKNKEDMAVISSIVQETIPPAAQVMYLTADICRKDLLVEIEMMVELGNA